MVMRRPGLEEYPWLFIRSLQVVSYEDDITCILRMLTRYPRSFVVLDGLCRFRASTLELTPINAHNKRKDSHLDALTSTLPRDSTLHL